jgi:5-methylcytosine-specific restriction endonuclease McrA
MFDVKQPGADPGTTTPDSLSAGPSSGRGPAEPVPLERLEAQICELAGHLAAATCRFLVLVGDFDARRGWATWEMNSCAQWLSWKCQLSPGTAREHVRVARALRDLPVLRAEFAAGRLSYAKIRALTRIATPATEQGLAEIAAPMTASQLDRFARAHRQVTHADDDAARVRRRLAWRFDDDGSLAGTFRLPPLQGAVLLQALRAAAADLDRHPHAAAAGGVPAGMPPAGDPPADRGPAADGSQPAVVTSTGLADALLAIAEAFLAGKIATADDPEVYQVIVHVGTDTLTLAPAVGAPASDTPASGAPAAGDPAGVPAGTPAPARPGHPAGPADPADPGRCHVEDGHAISISTAQMLTCTAALSWMLHDRDGTILDLGRRRRRPTSALRRAARERDHCRCRYPGCESRRTDLHHIQYWANGGRTSLDNLVNLCKRHHTLIHDRGYLIAAGPGGTFTFYQPDGTVLPASPALPPTGNQSIEDCHDADITPDTIIPAWYGERLNLDDAIYVCFANARTPQERQDQRDQAQDPQLFQPSKWIVEPSDWIRYINEHTAA